jgi:hypothetical protein
LRLVDTESQGLNGILVVHGAIAAASSDHFLSDVKTVVNHNPMHGSDMRGWLTSLLGDCGTIDPTSRRATFLVLATPEATVLPRFDAGPAFAEWTSADQWLWRLSRANRYSPDPESLATARAQQLLLSADLRAAVSRDGIALVGLRADRGSLDRTEFFNGAQFFTHGLYTDVLLVALAQRLLISKLGSAIHAVASGEASEDDLDRLERRLLAFRSNYWISDFAPQGAQNDFLRLYQVEHRLGDRLQQIATDISDYSRRVQISASEATNAALGIIALVGLPLSIAIYIWQSVSRARTVALLASLGVALAIIVAMMRLHPVGRRLWRLLHRGPAGNGRQT